MTAGQGAGADDPEALNDAEEQTQVPFDPDDAAHQAGDDQRDAPAAPAAAALAKLTSLVPPPASPVETGEAGRWDEVEAALGTALPSDYKALIGVYGSGRFGDFLYLFNPFAPSGDGNLADEKDAVLKDYAESRAKFPERYPLPPFPEPGGVLPLGRTDNGDELYWITEGAPDAWPVALFGSRESKHERHEGGVVVFLIACAEGRLETGIMPKGIAKGGTLEFAPFE
jgi:hypothetical protein